eukprot:10190428-Ditylum_brightwellii.AAC.2
MHLMQQQVVATPSCCWNNLQKFYKQMQRTPLDDYGQPYEWEVTSKGPLLPQMKANLKFCSMKQARKIKSANQS